MKIDRLYMDIQLLTTIGIGKRVIDIGDSVPKIASESQKIYAYRPTGRIYFKFNYIFILSFVFAISFY